MSSENEYVGEVVIGEEGFTKGWTVVRWRSDLPPIPVGTKLYAALAGMSNHPAPEPLTDEALTRHVAEERERNKAQMRIDSGRADLASQEAHPARPSALGRRLLSIACAIRVGEAARGDADIVDAAAFALLGHEPETDQRQDTE